MLSKGRFTFSLSLSFFDSTDGLIDKYAMVQTCSFQSARLCIVSEHMSRKSQSQYTCILSKTIPPSFAMTTICTPRYDNTHAHLFTMSTIYVFFFSLTCIFLLLLSALGY
jgi:hypothetical protein